MLIWVKLLLAHVAGGATPRATHCQCTDQCSASLAAILALLLATALANCSSLHVEQTFLMVACEALGFLERYWQRDFSRTTILRSPNVSIDVLHICSVGRGCSHIVRV